MVFTSHIFLFGFLPITLLGYWGLRSARLRLGWLTLASYIFYAAWSWKFLPLMLASTCTDFIAGRVIASDERQWVKRTALISALTLNLGILALFKYAGFFADSTDGLLALLGVGSPLPIVHLVLPLGISFYTFNSMSYTIDVYRGRLAPEQSLLRYCAFVALFPHLIAGPIVRYEQMKHQLARLHPRLTADMASRGLFFIACGCSKKLLIADSLAPDVNRLYAAHAHLGLTAAWLAALGYSLQLYFDFSGYSDIAVGLALLLGFDFPQNFNSPFKAPNIADFWRRWHMSLSSWLRDYLYIPLGGSRGGTARSARNLAIVMLLGGLWHGAAATFVVWGAIHGTLLAGHAVLRARGWTPNSRIFNRLVTFICVVAAFVVFRSNGLHSAGDILGSMIGLGGIEPGSAVSALLGTRFALTIAALLVFVNVVPNTWELRFNGSFTRGLGYGLLFGSAILAIAGPSPFLYYQF
ncbi:MAG: alginate O-acetyltransferase complex protein AlgI [Gaiellales bacterium]|nr:alginate O-acetyltransferase complex protein AlgI [Gaiellales bacterium]